VEVLKQGEREPWATEDQVAGIYSGTGGYIDRIKAERVQEFLAFLLARLHSEQQELMGKIAEGEWSDEIESQLGNEIAEAIDDFGPDFDAEGNPLEEGESDRIRAEHERERPGRHPESGDGSDDDGSAEDEGDDAPADDREEEAATT
jgi:hypothetical protein